MATDFISFANTEEYQNLPEKIQNKMQKVYDKRIAAELQLQKDREKQEEERLRKEKERLLQLEEQQIREKEFYSKQILRRIEDENVKESIRILAKFKEGN